MFIRILRDSFFRQKRRKAVVLAAIALGTAAAAALGDIALDIGDKMSGELRSFGANLVVRPRGGGAPVLVGGEDVSPLRLPAYLGETDVLRIKDNFWKNNILAIAPLMDVPVTSSGRSFILMGTWFERNVTPDPSRPEETFLTGIRSLNPYWSIEGRWPDDRARQGREAPQEVVLGRSLAEALGLGPGGTIEIEGPAEDAALHVAGILSTGSEEDECVLAPIETAWRLTGQTARVSRVALRALTTPESAVYERMGKDPSELSPAEFERWSCTPFVSSIAYEIERAVPAAEARVIRRIADSEGRILRRTSGLMLLIALMAAVGSALTVTSALTTSVLERRSEIGLLKAMGAGGPRVVGLFLAESATLGVCGGVIGAALGALMAKWISMTVFGSAVTIRPLSLPLAVAVALAITCVGCILPARRIMALRPFEVLRGL